MPVARIAVQADPMPSSLVLAGIACVMQMSSDYLSYQKKLAEVLSRMGRKANIITQLSDHLCEDNDQIQEALIEVYGDILEFCREALKPLVNENGEKRNTRKILGSSLLHPFDESKFGQIAGNFEMHLDHFRGVAEVCTRRMETGHRSEQQRWNHQMLCLQYQGQYHMSMSHETISQLYQWQIQQSRELERAAQGECEAFLSLVPS